MRRINILLIISALSLICARQASAVGFYCKQVGIAEGLSQPSITCLAEDRDGALWIGTRFGLNRYRSNRITPFFDTGADAPIQGNYIHCLFLDPSGTLWAATDRGLSTWDPETDRFRLRLDEHFFCAAAFDGRLWFGGDRGIMTYDPDTDTFRRRMEGQGLYLIRLLRDGPDSVIAVDKGQGLFRVPFEDGPAAPLAIAGLDQPLVIMDAQLADGKVYLSIYLRGLTVIDLDSARVERTYDRAGSGLTSDVILSGMVRDGRLWLGTDGGGICLLDLADGTVGSAEAFLGMDPDLIPTNSITVLYPDRRGNVWAGSVRMGLFGLKETAIRTLKASPYPGRRQLSNNLVISLCKGADGSVFIGTDGGGVNRYDPAGDDTSFYPSTAGQKISSLVELDRRTLLLSVYSDGLWMLDRETGRQRRLTIVDAETNARECFTGGAPMLYRIEDGRILVCAVHAYVYDPRTRGFTQVIPEGRWDIGELKVFDHPSPYTWTAYTRKGIYRLDTRSCHLREVHRFGQEHRVNAAAQVDSTLWLGTDYGLERMRTDSLGRPGSPERFETPLFHRVTWLQNRDGILWIAADNALFSLSDGTLRRIGESEGFPPNEILAGLSPLEQGGGAFYCGGSEGFVEILPAPSPAEGPRVPGLYGVVLDGRKVPVRDGRIQVRWNYIGLTLYVNVCGSDPFDRQLFRYTVDHVDTETYDDFLSLGSLQSGLHTVQVALLDKDGRWTPPTEVLDIHISTPWFRSWWFFLGLLALVGLCVAGVIHRAHRKSQQRLALTLTRWVRTTPGEAGLPQEAPLSPSERELLDKMTTYIEANLSDNDLNVDRLAKEMAMSRATLYAKVKKITGLGVAQYVDDIRIRRACRLLKETELPILEISERLGFSTPNYFSSHFKQVIGITPKTYRREG